MCLQSRLGWKEHTNFWIAALWIYLSHNNKEKNILFFNISTSINWNLFKLSDNVCNKVLVTFVIRYNSYPIFINNKSYIKKIFTLSKLQPLQIYWNLLHQNSLKQNQNYVLCFQITVRSWNFFCFFVKIRPKTSLSHFFVKFVTSQISY